MPFLKSKNLFVSLEGTTTVYASFASGLTLQVSLHTTPSMSMLRLQVTMPGSLKNGDYEGLLGNCNNKKSDDIRPNGGAHSFNANEIKQDGLFSFGKSCK